MNPLRLDLAVRSEVDQILSRRRKGITTSKRWIGEAQAEIKGSLEEVGEGDQTVVVAATVDGRVDSRPTAPHLRVPASRAHPPSFFFSPPPPFSGCQILMSRWHKDLRSDKGS